MSYYSQDPRKSPRTVFPEVFSYSLVVSVAQNAPILGFFRLIDFWIWAVFTVLLMRHNNFSRGFVLWGIAVFSFALLSSLQGAIVRNIVNFEMLVFYYKYATLLSAFFIIYCVVSGSAVFKLKYWNFALFAIATYLSLYVIWFIYNNPLTIASSATRVSVPLSFQEEGTSNSPMFSVVLAMLALASLVVFQAPNKLRFPLFLVTMISLTLTGSRSGLFVVMVFGIVVFVRSSTNIKVLILFILGSVFSIMNSFSGENLVTSLYERTLNFKLSGDQSANDRLSKQLGAIRDVFSNDFWLGIGHEYTTIVWYDGMTGNMLVMFGFWGSLLFASGVLFYCHKLYKCRSLRLTSARPAFFVVALLVASLISEFVLTSYPLGIVIFISVVAMSRQQRSKYIPNTFVRA